MNKFDKDEFITECLAAVRSGNGASTAVKEIVDRAVSNPWYRRRAACTASLAGT